MIQLSQPFVCNPYKIFKYKKSYTRLAKKTNRMNTRGSEEMNVEILDMDATTLAKKLRTGEISSVQATTTYIQQMKRANPNLNFLVEDRFTHVLQEAEQCDQMLKEGKGEGRLFGVPISMKECFDVAGMKTTGGLSHLKDYVVDQDAEIVTKLRAEGAIILGKTNTPTLCFCQETDNKLYGRSNNPWDITRTTGGSSGGEAACIAVGGAAVGIGSDIGGSIRFPSHFNGVIGFKSGANQVSQIGHFPPVTDPYQEKMLGIGAIAKSVADAELINEILAVSPPEEIDLINFELIIPPIRPKVPIGEETKELLEKVKSYLSNQYSITDPFPPYFEKMAMMWQLFMSIDGGAGVANHAFPDKKSGPIKEYIKELFYKNADIHLHLSWGLIGVNLFKPSNKQLDKLKHDLAMAQKESKDYFHQKVLIVPIYHEPTLPHGEVYNEIFSIRKTYLKYMPYVSIANTLGLPALTIPVGENKNGLPIAIQLITTVGQEKSLFYFGRLIEQSFRGYRRCTLH
jgi:fatty acid amide hydrolase 2